ncbi:transposable element Tcb2 transposase [Trichonephila clavipes]|uniref:Transposable element Tcb2 transposase n=1 Tax=Trichonephila clavipes TaxID=2585209 RepID=A0A8X6T0T0_TRICX|nr:transposable element Tcb2 transposase [Trichonephila clavipes]
MANNQSVRRHPDFFTRARIIGKLEEGRSVTSVAAEFGIAHSIVPRLWRQFQTTGTATRGFSSGRPRGTTPTDDRYIVLQARRNRRQTAGEIARHTTQVTGRPISRFTVARRMHGGGLFARRPVRCVPLTPAHRRRRSLWCREHRNWRDNEWGRVLFTDESRFSLSSDSHRILIWRERGSRNDPSNIIERDRYGGRGVLVWGGIMLGSRTDLHIFDAGSINETRYCNEILLPYVRLFRGAMGLQFLFMDDNAPCHRTVAAEQLLESEDIERKCLAARTLPPVTIRELRLALQDEWAAMPQQLIDTLILSMGRRCETCLAHSHISALGAAIAGNGSRTRFLKGPSLSPAFLPELLHRARATIDLLKDTFGDRLISRFGPVNWPPRSCDLTPLDYFLWGYVKSLVYADKPQTRDHLEDNIRRVIADIRPQMLEKVIENWTSKLDYIRASRGSRMPEIIFKM